MKDSPFFKQAELLIRILPIVYRENIFAIKGGTAINFFIRDIPRLSVDIDLVYLPIAERKESLNGISSSLVRIENSILKLIPKSVCKRKISENNVIGLVIKVDNAIVKIETNTVIRGSVYEVEELKLCDRAKEIFELDARVNSLSFEELYAGKICAALDRQHPRDLFDIKLLFENEGINEKTRRAFIVYLISHNRPIIELLNPNRLDISKIYTQEFIGMTSEEVELNELIEIREKLVTKLNSDLTREEKKFLISFKSMEPDWDLLGLTNIEKLPSVQWKLLNMKKMDPKKQGILLANLKIFLDI